jgi:hypothetical protein
MTVPVVGDPVLADHNAHGSLDNVSDGGHQVRGQEEPLPTPPPLHAVVSMRTTPSETWR